MDERLSASLQPGGRHHRLQQLIGEWEGMTRTWFAPGDPSDESPTRGVMRPILDGRFVIYEYEGTVTGQPMVGIVIIGYDLTNERFQSAWVDTFHMGTGILFSQGARGAEALAVSATYPAPDGPDWGWRTEIDLPEPDRLVITAYIIKPTGEEAKATETVYTRR